jgi:hypothetical protein
MINTFVIEYHSCYAYLFYDFKKITQQIADEELSQIDHIAQKYVKMSCEADEQSHHTRSCTFGYIVVHSTYLPALLDELVPVFEKIMSVKM